MAVLNVTQAISSSMMTVLLNAVDADAAAGYIEFYTGTMPAKPEAAPGRAPAARCSSCQRGPMPPMPFMPPMRFIIFMRPPPFIFFIISCICSNSLSMRLTSWT